MDKKAEALYKDLMTGFVPFLLLHVFLPILRLRKNRFIRDLGFLEKPYKGE